MSLRTSMEKINFTELAAKLLPFAEAILVDNCPGGTIVGREYCAATINGGHGDSFKFNLQTGKWAEFNGGDSGTDVISFFAANTACTQLAAAKHLQDLYLKTVKHEYPVIVRQQIKPSVIKPPTNALFTPPMKSDHTLAGHWTYVNAAGEQLFHICRYNQIQPDGSIKKTFTPFTFSTKGTWEQKAWPTPRPLYKLDQIANNPNKPVLLVEGERSADAAQLIVGDVYVTTCWPNGANAVKHSDFTPLKGRSVLLWPDSDEAGFKAMLAVIEILQPICTTLKLINTDLPDGHDAADFKYKTYDMWAKWARPKLSIFECGKPATVEPEQPAVEVAQVEIIDPQDEFPDEYYNSIIDEVKSIEDKKPYAELGIRVQSKKNPTPIPNTTNAALILKLFKPYTGKIFFDTLQQAIVTTYNCDKPRKWTDADTYHILNDMQLNYDMPKITKNMVADAVEMYAFQNKKNELQDWLNSLEWDQTPRVVDFMCNAYEAEPSAYTFAVSRNWWVGLVARALKPGCKFDEMLILEGRQGIYKSTSLQIIGGKYFAEINAELGSKDFMQELAGNWIVEFDELDQFRRADVTLIKKKLSQRVDRYRPPYGRAITEIPRSCVFVGTTNKTDYLMDETGGRRFWPIQCEKCDIDYIKEHRTQLIAEAVHLFKSGATWHEMPLEETQQQQEARRSSDVWEDEIEKFLDSTPWITFTNLELLTQCLQIEVGKISKMDEMRAAKCLRALGYKRISARIDDRIVKRWKKEND